MISALLQALLGVAIGVGGTAVTIAAKDGRWWLDEARRVLRETRRG